MQNFRLIKGKMSCSLEATPFRLDLDDRYLVNFFYQQFTVQCQNYLLTLLIQYITDWLRVLIGVP